MSWFELVATVLCAEASPSLMQSAALKDVKTHYWQHAWRAAGFSIAPLWQRGNRAWIEDMIATSAR